MDHTLNYIDLFAGAGGLSEGFIKAGFNPIAHVEIDEAACYTLKTRIAYYHLKSQKKLNKYIAYLRGEIDRTQLYSQVPYEKLDSVINCAIGGENNKQIFKKIDKHLNNKQVDLIIGGPPCQAYSLVGRARDRHGMKYDPRNHLFIEYAEFLKKYNPKVFVFENVMGLLSADNGKYFKEMILLFDNCGYKVTPFNLEAKNFGVLQNRKRIILIGYRKNLKISLPEFEKHETRYLVKNIFEDLPKLQAGEGMDKFTSYRKSTNEYLEIAGIRNGIDVVTQHVSRPHTEQDKEIYKIAIRKWNEQKERLDYNDLPEKLKTHKNRKSFFDRFKVVAADIPYSQTVVAHIAKDGHYYIHPDIKQARSITVREAARLQSFPDDYYFEGVKEGKNRTAAFKQIGNAVPPLMGYAIAKTLKNMLNEY